MSIRQIAKLLGIAHSTATRLVREGGVTSFRVGTRVLVPRAAVERLLQGSSTGAPAA